MKVWLIQRLSDGAYWSGYEDDNETHTWTTEAAKANPWRSKEHATSATGEGERVVRVDADFPPEIVAHLEEETTL